MSSTRMRLLDEGAWGKVYYDEERNVVVKIYKYRIDVAEKRREMEMFNRFYGEEKAAPKRHDTLV